MLMLDSIPADILLSSEYNTIYCTATDLHMAYFDKSFSAKKVLQILADVWGPVSQLSLL